MKRFKSKGKVHEPVMVREVLDFLNLAPLKTQARIIDATVGAGGHAIEIVKAKAQVLGIDADRKMLKIAEERLQEACPASHQISGRPFKLVQGNFAKLDKIARENDFTGVEGILFDLGISSAHLASANRGFSFTNPEDALDMRLDPDTQAVTAADLLNLLPKKQLRKLFEVAMTERKAAKIAKAVVLARDLKPIKKVGDLLTVTGKKLKSDNRLHPATLPFLALRIAVNSELENLREALPKAFQLLKTGGRLVVISFHSGEDAIVKKFFRTKQKQGLANVLTKKPVLPKEDEVRANPRARSAKLRAIERL